MIFAGNKPESEAAHYQDRRFTHTARVNGRDVNYYDCWSHDDEHRPAFGETLNVRRVKDLDNVFKNSELPL